MTVDFLRFRQIQLELYRRSYPLEYRVHIKAKVSLADVKALIPTGEFKRVPAKDSIYWLFKTLTSYDKFVDAFYEEIML